MGKTTIHFNIEEFTNAWLHENLSQQEMAERFHMSISSVKKYVKQLKLQKTEEQRVAKIQQTTLEHYGVSHALQSNECKEKAQKTYKSKTGFNTPAQNPEVLQRRKKTNLEKYGCENPMQCADIKNKAVQTNLEKYGYQHPMQNPEIYNTWCDAYEQKTGYRNPSKNPDVQNKRQNSFINAFGVNNPSLVNYTQEQLNILQDAQHFREFILSSQNNTVSLLCDYFNVKSSTVYRYIRQYSVDDIIDFSSSIEENEVRSFLNELGIKNIRTKDIIPPYEIDMYCEEYKIGIEFNGTYWHSSLRKNKQYHLNKTKAAAQKGVRLIHIYEYEWNNPIKREIIKSMLRIAFGQIDKRIYARNCVIKQITNTDAREFNNTNHLQGHRNAEYTYGLFYQDQLVQLMSFTYDKKNQWWEIIRGCPGSNNIVVGGVSKLFTHFIKTHNPEKIFSYCDYNKFDGKGYEAIGMNLIGLTGPDMKWVQSDWTVVNRRPGKHKTLKENAVAQIWGAGSKRYLWTKEENTQS